MVVTQHEVSAVPVGFMYRAAASSGRVRSGVIRARSRAEASKRLAERGLVALALRPLPRFATPRRVSRHDLAAVFRNVATLVEAGVPIERAIGVSEPLVPARLAGTLVDVRTMLREGRSVGDALGAHPYVFPRAVVGILRAGEAGSSLAEACRAVAEQLEESAELHSRVRSALAYPAFILLVGVATILVVGTVVVPRFASLLEDLGADLPPTTVALLGASAILQQLAPTLVVLVPSVALVAAHGVSIASVRARLDSLLLRLPLVGGLRHGFASARMCRALGGMLARGMPLLAALDAATEGTGDAEVSRRLGRARESVAKGATLTSALRQEAAVNAMALQLIGVGESSGNLGAMVSRAGAAAAERAERSLRTTIALVEPMLVVVLGVLVAAVAAALLQAVYSIRPL